MPGSDQDIPEWSPTIADVLKEQGHAPAQSGENHLGDQDQHLPTKHGFNEFFGNLDHPDAEEEPEIHCYPQAPAFREQYGPGASPAPRPTARGPGPLNRERVETINAVFPAAAMGFLHRTAEQDQPFFMWFNATRMHVWTHLKLESMGGSAWRASPGRSG